MPNAEAQLQKGETANFSNEQPQANSGGPAAGIRGEAGVGADINEAASSSDHPPERAAGKEQDAEWRRQERERIAKYLSDKNKRNSNTGDGTVLIGKHFEIRSATRIMRAEMLIEKYWSIFERGSGVAAMGAGAASSTGDGDSSDGALARAWEEFDSADFFLVAPSSGIKQRGVKNFGEPGAHALLSLWAHRSFWLCSRFKSPKPSAPRPEALKQMKASWKAFSQTCVDECKKLNINDAEIDKFGGMPDAVYAHLRVTAGTTSSCDVNQLNVGSAADGVGAHFVSGVADEDLSAPPPAACGDETFGRPGDADFDGVENFDATREEVVLDEYADDEIDDGGAASTSQNPLGTATAAKK
eukprot:g15317.t1